MFLRFFKTGLILGLIFLSNTVLGLDPEERRIISAIRSGDISYVKAAVEERTDVDCVFSNGKSGLFYAIKHNCIEITRLFLDKGADPDHISAKLTLLEWAIRDDRRRIARLLIEYGANVNFTDSKLNTPLILAAKLNNIWMCKLLIDRGANPSHENLKGQRASNFTIYWEDQNTHKYLLGMEKRKEISELMSSMQDGPYIFHDDNELVMQYFEHIKSDNLTRMFEKTLPYQGNDTVLKGIRWDEKTYHVKKNYRPIPYEISTNEPIFVMGDIHGKFKPLLSILRKNKIIDSNNNWIFGKGILVFLGDIFDRGSQVTETLWFIHELTFNAEKAGGRVILLLGNHEIMSLTGDHRYVNDKYGFFNHYTLTNYYQLYDRKTVLGKWLRNQNVIIQINDNLFMHAGISPQFAENKYSFPAVNLGIQNYLNAESEASTHNIVEETLGSYGPFWYRGYMSANTNKVPQDFVDDYLKSKGLKRMILGHNEQRKISTSYNGKIISVDIHISDDGTTAQGLLIKNNKLYRCYSNGKQELMK